MLTAPGRPDTGRYNWHRAKLIRQAVLTATPGLAIRENPAAVLILFHAAASIRFKSLSAARFKSACVNEALCGQYAPVCLFVWSVCSCLCASCICAVNSLCEQDFALHKYFYYYYYHF